MFQTLTVFLIGFSVLSAVILAVAYLQFLPDMRKTGVARVACFVLLAVLAGLQTGHYSFLLDGTALMESRIYVILLLIAPPAFYFFSREVLLETGQVRVWDLAHFLPLAVSFVAPTHLVAPVAFLIGTGYAIWFARLVWGMRAQRSRFRAEMFFFALFSVQAVVVLVLGTSVPFIDPGIFYVAYANCIGAALMLVVAALLFFPELLSDIAEAAQAAYATSTLGGVDVDDRVAVLERLMLHGRIFADEDLNLAAVAGELGLTPHQTSELINTRFGIGFSRYVREHRVREAKRLLREDLKSSVLTIGLTTGFRSQSNFYAAFREICGESPGAYRKRFAATRTR